jgi:hypothetical protein
MKKIKTISAKLNPQKKYFIVKDKNFGSGKVKRRVFIRENQRKKKIKLNDYSEALFLRNRSKEKISAVVHGKKPIDFRNSSVKIIFKTWNNYGYPFTTHREVNSVTAEKSINAILRALIRHETRTIVAAFDLAHQTFTSGQFKYKVIQKSKISLVDFFHYREIVYAPLFKRYGKSFPRSWFDEFLKGREYIIRKYSFSVKEKDNWITQQLKKIWSEYKQGNVNTEDGNISWKFIKLSNMIFNFCKMNEIRPDYLLDVLDGALNKWHTVRLSRLTYAMTHGFFNETIPMELRRYDSMGFKNWIFKTDWQEISK